jgi:hypothetical protein
MRGLSNYLLHAAVGEINDFSEEDVIAMQVEKNFCGLWMVDIEDFEMDPLISQIHHPCPLSPLDVDGRR